MCDLVDVQCILHRTFVVHRYLEAVRPMDTVGEDVHLAKVDTKQQFFLIFKSLYYLSILYGQSSIIVTTYM